MGELVMLHVMPNTALLHQITSNISQVLKVPRNRGHVFQLLMLIQCAYLCVCFCVHVYNTSMIYRSLL